LCAVDLCVEEDDFGVRDRLADEVDEHGVAEASGDDQLVTELLPGPTQDVERVSSFETGRHCREVERLREELKASKQESAAAPSSEPPVGLPPGPDSGQ